MVVAVETPTRRQLAELVDNNPEMIALFERLFDQAGKATPTETAEITDEIVQAQSDIIENANDITFNAAAIENNAVNIASNVAAIETNTEDIAINASGIAANAADIGDLDIRVTDLEASSKIIQAQNVVFSSYGDTVSVADKKKNLNKFGTASGVTTTPTTVAQFQGAVINETYLSTNLIDSVVSSSASDTMTIAVEGHTIDGAGNLTFIVQDVIVTGQTEAALTTPLARASSAYVKASGVFNSPQSDPIGIISIYDNTGGITAGVPNVASETKLVIEAGFSQSEKCATTVSAGDYWFISTFSAGVGDAGGSANRVTFFIETLDVANGGVWRPSSQSIVVTLGQNSDPINFDPLLIVPKNHDLRVVAFTNNNTAEVFAELRGVLASVAV